MPQYTDVPGLFEDALVATTATITSGIINMRFKARGESLWWKASSVSGLADVEIGWIGGLSDTDTDRFEPIGSNPAIIVSSNTQHPTTPESWHKIELPNFLSPFVRFYVRGVGSNPADTRVSLKLFLREDYE